MNNFTSVWSWSDWDRMTGERVNPFTGSIRGTIFTNFCVAPNHAAYQKGSLSDSTLGAPRRQKQKPEITLFFFFCKYYVAQVGCWERGRQTHLCLWLLGNLLQRTSRRFAQGFFWQERGTQHCCDHSITLCELPNVHCNCWDLPFIRWLTDFIWHTWNFLLLVVTNQVCS